MSSWTGFGFRVSGLEMMKLRNIVFGERGKKAENVLIKWVMNLDLFEIVYCVLLFNFL